MDTSTDQLFSKLQDTLVELFTIVGHSKEEAEENYTQMMGTTNQLAISELVSTLPQESRDMLLQQLQSSKTVEEAFGFVKANFSSEQFREAMIKAFNHLTQLYFSQISDTLSQEQRKQIETLLFSSISE